MRLIQQFFIYARLIIFSCLSMTAYADTDTFMVEGVVRKIDTENRKVTIKHGEIKSFDMPPMTMVFTVKDPVLLDAAKPGDKVRFGVAREDGKFVVTAIEVVP